jgi:hypothetical protein
VAKKQTFADKTDKSKAAGAAHCPVCNEIQVPTKVREFVSDGGPMKLVTKQVKICKCNVAQIYG